MISITFFKHINFRVAVPRLGLTAAGLVLALAGTQAIAVDSDADGIDDDLDNCIKAPNGPLILDAGGNSQLDTDGDGYGNLCDADLDNSGGVVNFADLALFKAVFGTNDADADFDGNNPPRWEWTLPISPSSRRCSGLRRVPPVSIPPVA